MKGMIISKRAKGTFPRPLLSKHYRRPASSSSPLPSPTPNSSSVVQSNLFVISTKISRPMIFPAPKVGPSDNEVLRRMSPSENEGRSFGEFGCGEFATLLGINTIVYHSLCFDYVQ
jgi:hypothetical protein